VSGPECALDTGSIAEGPAQTEAKRKDEFDAKGLSKLSGSGHVLGNKRGVVEILSELLITQAVAISRLLVCWASSLTRCNRYFAYLGVKREDGSRQRLLGVRNHLKSLKQV